MTTTMVLFNVSLLLPHQEAGSHILHLDLDWPPINLYLKKRGHKVSTWFSWWLNFKDDQTPKIIKGIYVGTVAERPSRMQPSLYPNM